MRAIQIDLNVLIVDDNRHMLGLLRTTLRDLRIRTAKAFESVETAFRYCERNRPDVIFTDWEMAPISGIEFVRMVRQHHDPVLKKVPIVMVTAHADPERVAAARDAGVSEFVVKPISIGVIQNRLSSIFQRPRIFIRTPDYSGPNRRRSQRAFSGPERRRPVEDLFTGLFSGSGGLVMSPSAPNVFDEINRKFEASLPEAVERIRQECQIAVDDRFNRRGHMGRVYRLVHDLKGQGGTFGYPLLSQTATLLCRFIDRAAAFDAPEMAIVSSHIDTLYLIAKHKIKGDGGPTGRALIDKLNAMVQGYEPTM